MLVENFLFKVGEKVNDVYEIGKAHTQGNIVENFNFIFDLTQCMCIICKPNKKIINILVLDFFYLFLLTKMSKNLIAPYAFDWRHRNCIFSVVECLTINSFFYEILFLHSLHLRVATMVGPNRASNPGL